MNVLEAKYCDIIYDESTKIVITKWKGYATSEQFRGILEKALEFLVSKKASKWLGDCTHLPTLLKPDVDWVNTEWFPKAVDGGIKKMAVVLPDKTIQKNIVDKIMDKNGAEIMQSSNFSEYEEAFNWLK